MPKLKVRVVKATMHDGLSLRVKNKGKTHGIHGMLEKSGFKEGDEAILVKEDHPCVCCSSRKIKATKEMVSRLENGEWKRSSGHAKCSVCKVDLFCHKWIEGYGACVLDCNNEIHKL